MSQHVGRLGGRRPAWHVLVAWPALLTLVVAIALVGGAETPPLGAVEPQVTPTAPSASLDGAAPTDAASRRGDVTPVRIAPGPMAVTAGLGAIWVASVSDTSVRRLDPRTARVETVTNASAASSRTTTAGAAPDGSVPTDDGSPLLAVGAGAVWAAGLPARTEVVRIDPATGRVAARVVIDSDATGILGDERGMWVTTDDGAVVRIDPATNQVTAAIPTAGRPVYAALGDTALWVSSAGRVLRVDPADGRVLAEITGGGGPIGVRDAMVWFRSPGTAGPTLVGVEEATGRVVERADIATSGRAELAWLLPSLRPADAADDATWHAPRRGEIVELAGTTWLVRPDRGEVWRIDGG